MYSLDRLVLLFAYFSHIWYHSLLLPHIYIILGELCNIWHPSYYPFAFSCVSFKVYHSLSFSNLPLFFALPLSFGISPLSIKRVSRAIQAITKRSVGKK